MKNKLVMAAILLLSMGTVQATPLTYTGLYQTTDQVDLFYFDNLSVGDVDIWADTFSDGLSQAGSLFVKDNGTGDYNWTGVQIFHADADDYNPITKLNSSGDNNYGVAMKNGYVHGDPTAVGISDIGATVQNLAIGSYMVVISEDFNLAAPTVPNAASPVFDGSMVRAIPSFIKNWKSQTWSTPGGVDHSFELYVSGDVAVSAVPVPAAVWLFTSAMAGLGLLRRKSFKV